MAETAKEKNLIVCLSCIGHEENDSPLIKQRKEFLIYMGLIMSGGGIVWGSLCLIFGLTLPAVIPFGYTFLTAVNFLFFNYSKNFPVVRSVQMTMSILLPFLFQWALGGFISSGAVMMWATLSLIASLSFQDTKSSIWWLVLFLVLNIASAVIEPYVHEVYNIHLPIQWSAIFFVINISVAVAVVFSLVVYFINVRDKVNVELDQKHKALKQSQTQLIQSEKLAVLGQLIAGVAHEVNTPLGAIQASVGIISDATRYLTTEFPPLLEELDQNEKKELFELLKKSSGSSSAMLSAKEERQHKRKLAAVLEENDINDADSLADTFVDIGVYDNIEPYIPLVKNEKGEKILKAVYNLSEQNKNSSNIKIAVERASKVVFALKNYSHRNNSESKIYGNVIKGIETVLTLYHNQIKKGITINKHFSDVPDILCYPDELNQVWTNIIHNAIQAMDNHGTIDVDAGTEGENIVVKITDSGKGIPPEILPRIFEPFFTTKPAGEGSGLGLDIVKQIVTKHSGEISVQSVPGKTTFTVKLPIIR